MMNLIQSLISLIIIILPLSSGSLDFHRRHGICSWMSYSDSLCPKIKFLCGNGECIDRHLFCDGKNDCGDSSDEYDCSCSNYNTRNRRCGRRCVPGSWFCDGINDCFGGEDEHNCDYSKFNKIYLAMIRGLKWLYNQSKTESATEVWGPLVDKTSVALYLTDYAFTVFDNGTRKEVAYEVSIQFLSKLFKSKLQGISSNDLASYLNAFLVSCIDPRKFHGIDMVQELRNRVDRENFTNPYVLLSLCNVGEKITEMDKAKLLEIFRNKHRTFWTDMQAFSIMALVCASKQEKNGVDLETLSELAMELKQHQYRNGSVENLQTTALVMQALFSVEHEEDPDNFDEGRAMDQIIANQKPDGSFGNLINTYFVLPVLSCKSLVKISSDHCKSIRRDEMSALVELENRAGPKKRVEYSLWIGDEKDLERNLVLRVPLNMSLYAIMEIAAEVDSKYSFEYVVKNRKPYINAISELQDNPEKGKFWFLYEIIDGKPTPSQESPADVVPIDNNHFVMWYRSGSWVD